MSLSICKFYSRNKSCRFGSNCRNLHPPRAPPLTDLQSISTQDEKYIVEENFASNSVPKRRTDHIENGNQVLGEVLDISQGLEIQSQSSELQQKSSSSHENGKSKPEKLQICKYFSRGGCYYGKKCRFSHTREISKTKSGEAKLPPRFREEKGNSAAQHCQSNKVNSDEAAPHGHNDVYEAKVVEPMNDQRSALNAKKICPFFKQNRCNRGDRCRFAHPPKQRISKDEFMHHHNQQGNARSAINQDQSFLTFEEAEKIGFTKLRECEISVIKKRFSRNKIKVLEDDNQEDFVANIIFTPSDPDWPYDLNAFELLVMVPEDYPRREILRVSLTKEQDMPETIRRYIDSSISNWLKECAQQKNERHQIELMFRPFYEWLDKSICDITTNAFKQLKYELDAKNYVETHKAQINDSVTRTQEKVQTFSRKQPTKTVPVRPVTIKPFLTLEEAGKIGLGKLRESEITVIQKRFTKDKIKIVENGDNFVVNVIFSPSDPDWLYDINSFELLVTITKNYPKDMLKVSLPKEQNIPETVRRYIDITVSEWLLEKKKQKEAVNQVELMFRPFLKWFDRSIDEITTEALKQFKRELVAKAAGIEILSPSQLQEKLRVASESSDSTEGSEVDSQSDESEEGDSEEESSDEEENEQGVTLDLDPDKKGTEIDLRNLQLKENAAALLFDKIKLVLQCGRCKTHADLIVHQNRVVSLRCGKCSHNQFVNFRPAMIHSFSSTMGYLDLDGCTAFDLVLQDCRCQVTCMACSKMSKIEGLSTGQMVSGWCQACNGRFKIATESVKFTQLVPSEVPKAGGKVIEVASSKSRKPPKDPAICEGMPLPEFGTCRHYKHSYRWLRFPCCGKVYPCDVCHDKKEDHEMTFANRMICGHCCKEQNYSPDRPCTSCGEHMTKVRSAHWEGGQGCRDKIAMSRGDSAKHRNQSKTTSNHKKKVLNGGKPTKKNTKLRHS